MSQTATLLLIACISTAALAVPARVVDGIGWNVVGGSNAEPGAFPYIISLRYYGSHNCGGSILNNNWIVTAAHCVSGYNVDLLTVVAGTNTISTGGVTVGVKRSIVHENYDPISITNDVALLELLEPLEFSDLIQPVAISCASDDKEQDCLLAGWGSTSLGGSVPNDLQELQEHIILVKDCQDAWLGEVVVNTEVCALTKSGEGACHGDSGGPLVIINNSGAPVLTGIVSWGRPCAIGYPDVYTRVSSYCAWIIEKTL